MEIAFLQAAEDNTDATTYTFASQNLGTADSTRYIAVCVNSRSANSSFTISTVTVGGVSASIEIQRTNATSAESVAGIAIAAVPTGTTGDIVVTFSAGALRCGIVVYRILAPSGATASDTDSSITADPSMSIDVPAGGVAIATSNSANNSATATWTGLTEDDEGSFVAEQLTHTAASNLFASQQTGLTVQCTWTIDTNVVAVVASWAPAAVGRRFNLAPANSNPTPGDKVLWKIGPR